jgi:hypothetical protein
LPFSSFTNSPLAGFILNTGTKSSAPERINTSDSSASWYLGKPLSVFRVIEGSDKVQPNPNGQLPAPESYERESCGPNPERPGLVATGTVIDPVPVTGLAANFSPMLRIAPPPFGRLIAGGAGAELSSAALPFAPDTNWLGALTSQPVINCINSVPRRTGNHLDETLQDCSLFNLDLAIA